MAISIEDKRRIVADVHAQFSRAASVVLADYRGMSVGDLTRLRMQARGAGISVRVVRNLLACRAVDDTRFACLQDSFAGPTLVAFSYTDLSSAAKTLNDFARKHEKLRIKALSVGGKLLGPEEIENVARLPNREQALTQLMGLMLAPISRLAAALHDVPGRLVRTLAAIRDSRPNDHPS